jgi:hypothetical protein
MANTFVGIDVAGVKKLREKLDDLPPLAQDMGVEAANVYLLDSLKLSPPYRYVSRKTAYPPTGWFSDKQRRYVMAKIASGDIQIPYRRTQSLRNSWETLGYGVNQIVVNENPAAIYAYDDKRQARQLGLVGWKKIGDTLKERGARMLEKFDGGVKKAIQKLNLD